MESEYHSNYNIQFLHSACHVKYDVPMRYPSLGLFDSSRKLIKESYFDFCSSSNAVINSPTILLQRNLTFTKENLEL